MARGGPSPCRETDSERAARLHPPSEVKNRAGVSLADSVGDYPRVASSPLALGFFLDGTKEIGLQAEIDFPIHSHPQVPAPPGVISRHQPIG